MIKHILIIASVWLALDIILLIAWATFRGGQKKKLEKLNTLYAVDNRFANNDAINQENNAILRARKILS